jgi:hypothetical protein
MAERKRRRPGQFILYIYYTEIARPPQPRMEASKYPLFPLQVTLLTTPVLSYSQILRQPYSKSLCGEVYRFLAGAPRLCLGN